MIRRYLGFLVLRAMVRLLARVIRALVIVALILAAAPVSVVAAYSATLAWLLGWPPRHLYRAALYCVPMLAAWLAATAVATRSWARVAAAPQVAWLAMWHDAAAGSYALAAVTIAPAAVPLGLVVGGIGWRYRIYSMEAGTGGLTPSAPAAFDLRQWRHQVCSARARIAAPGSVPLISRNGTILAGAVIRAIHHPQVPLARIPYSRLRSHQVVIGTSGTGKTTLLLRLWAGFMAVGLQRHAAGAGRRPLLVVLDCKGGADSRRIAERTRRVLRGAGARTTAIWPDEASLSLWALPPGQLTTTLVDMIEHGTGGAAYYADVMEAIVTLAVMAPAGPPASAADFLDRLDAGWLTMAYASAERADEAAQLRSAGRHIGDIGLRFRTLFRRLGSGLDGPGTFADADVWYCILEGTSEIAVAEAQARALVDMLASYAASGAEAEILLAVDEFSAVSRRLPIWQLYERARSLGLAVQVSAQSWAGLAAHEDERYRVAATADGGIWLLRTPQPEPATALAGSRPVVDTTRRLLGAALFSPAPSGPASFGSAPFGPALFGPALWSHEGQSRQHRTPVVDADLIRRLAVGQAAYIYRGGVTFVQVKRLIAAPAELPMPVRPAAGEASRPAAAGVPGSPGRPELDGQDGPDGNDADGPDGSDGLDGNDAGRRAATRRRRPLPDAGSLLDEAFGQEAP
jgi:hypothetical protein